MDRVTAQTRSRIMAGVGSRRTQPERQVETLLRLAGVRHVRRNVRALPGCPDFVLRDARLAVFVDSCFWHGCRWHYRRPASRREYWDLKIERNVRRDSQVNALLKNMGWRVLRIWEHQIRETAGQAKVIAKVVAILGTGTQKPNRPARAPRK
jgi:DNA mismatch endonuclease Vsr